MSDLLFGNTIKAIGFLLTILGILLLCFTAPLFKYVWMPDSLIYGEFFTATFDGSSISTIGHYTATRISLFKYFWLKHNGYKLEEVE